MKNFLLFSLISFLIEGVFGESVTVTVTDGDSVTLHTGLTEIKEDDVLEWSFGAQRHRIARVRKDSKPTTYDVPDGRFRDRLKADGQTGDLTITNITSEHAGPYEISNKIKAIVTFRLIVVPADPVKTDPVSVMEGDSVTLKTTVNEILKYDVIQWRFGHQNSPIAEINRTVGLLSISNGTDERFRDRLQMDYLTGSLTIRNIGTEHSGLYEIDISRSKHTIHKSFNVTVRVVTGEIKSVKSVMEKNPVTLDTGLTEIQTDSIHWMFGDTRIAEFYKAGNRSSVNEDERFRDRLKLDQKNGSLTITQTEFTDSGHYDLKIISSRFTVQKRFTVTVTGWSSRYANAFFSILAFAAVVVAVAVAAAVIYRRRWISELKKQIRTLGVIEGQSVFLIPDDGINIQKDDIQWKYEDSIIAERRGSNGESTLHEDVLDNRFRNRLHLDESNGSLKIEDARFTDSGRYELRIIRSGHESVQKFIVCVCDPTDPGEMLLKGLSAQYQ